MSALLVYVTAPDSATAERLARAAVEGRWAACGNVLPVMHSVYRWRGQVEQATEAVLVLKTTEAAYPSLESELRRLHPYECPCIVALPLIRGSEAFLRWIEEECSPPST